MLPQNGMVIVVVTMTGILEEHFEGIRNDWAFVIHTLKLKFSPLRICRAPKGSPIRLSTMNFPVRCSVRPSGSVFCNTKKWWNNFPQNIHQKPTEGFKINEKFSGWSRVHRACWALPLLGLSMESPSTGSTKN